MVWSFQIAISPSLIVQPIFSNLEVLSLRDKSSTLNQFTQKEGTLQTNVNFLGNIEKIVIFLLFSMLCKVFLYFTNIPK